MFTHPDTTYVIRTLQNRELEQHAAQQRLAATAQPGRTPHVALTYSARQFVASWLYVAARWLAGEGNAEMSHPDAERALSLLNTGDA